MTAAVVTRDFEPDLARLLASDPEAIADPYPVWNRLREQAPAYRTSSALLLSRYADVKRLLRDSRTLSNRASFEGSRAEEIMGGLTSDQLDAHLEISSFEEKYVSRSDGDQHHRLRTIAHRTFTPRRIAELDASVRRYTDEMLDRMAEEGDTDIVARLAYPLPLMVITDLLEVPDADREQIHVWSNLIGRNRGGDAPEALLRARAALREFRAYVHGILDDRRRSPRTDLVSALMEAEAGQRLTEEELTAMFVVLLFAGHETTTNLIANGLLALHRQPDEWRRLCEDPELAMEGTEELLRFVSPVQFINRVAVEPVEVAGDRLEPGETLYFLLAAANRDPEAFAEPDRLDLSREGAKDHVGLGFGPHFCLGNALARMEGAVAFRTLARRFPAMEVQTEGLRWRGHFKLRGLERLPVRLR